MTYLAHMLEGAPVTVWKINVKGRSREISQGTKEEMPQVREYWR